MRNPCNVFVGRLLNAASSANSVTNDAILKLHFRMKDFLIRDEGQDLVEYALVVALIAFGGVISMKGLSAEIKTAFNSISSDLASSL
jgi:pilus assembly protein Flp/PilA